MNQEESMATVRHAVLGNVRGSFRHGRPTRIILTLTILACCAALSSPARATCKNSPTPNSPVGFSVPPASQAEAHAKEASSEHDEDDDVSIVGFWHVLFLTSGDITFDEGFDQWHGDGLEILNDNAPPAPANGTGNVCLGVYKKTGPRTYKSKHPAWIFDATGTLVGTTVILETLIVDRSGNHYSGSFEWINYDLKGKVTLDVTGELKADRITVD
jgi:hypothetical protein